MEFDQGPYQAARPFQVVSFSWGGRNPPVKSRLLSLNAYCSAASSAIRETVEAGIIGTFDCDDDATALGDVPLELICSGPAAEFDLNRLALPEVETIKGTASTILDGQMAAIGVEFSVVGLSSGDGVANHDALGGVSIVDPVIGRVRG